MSNMKFFINATWWRACKAMPSCSQNLTIAGNPQDWLAKQQKRIRDADTGSYGCATDIRIESCCAVGDDAEVSPEIASFGV
jgi:hypothetical protein